MKYAVFTLFFLINVKVNACDTLNTVCNTICIHDGNDKGIVINKKCYCADYRNLDDVFAKMPLSGKVVIDKESKRSFWE